MRFHVKKEASDIRKLLFFMLNISGIIQAWPEEVKAWEDFHP